ncbi:uroporphyrinogen-III synthase [Acinetobacter sp.]|uniref:uroporphyrinogen-III synthase n=1 Tax=Acinetobacter sp. TaxID=472 RepID=UPI0035B4C372
MTQHRSKPLINTRPVERATALSESLQALGYSVYELPLLSLEAIALDAELHAQFAQFKDAELVVVVSPIAVELGIQYASQCNISLAELQKKKWIAVGQSTQKALAKYKIDSECPTVETSEGMLQLPILNDLISAQSSAPRNSKSVCIAFWRGIGGRTLMMDELSAQGCTVLNILLYRRAMPNYTVDDLKQLAQQLPATVLVSSEQSWKNWQQLTEHMVEHAIVSKDIFSENQYVVLGDRVSQVLRDDLFPDYRLQDNLVDSAQILTVQHLQANEIDSVVQNRNNVE